MSVELLRIFWSLWALGVLVFIGNAFSRLLFEDAGDTSWSRLMAKGVVCVLFILIWPIALASPGGRKVILLRFNKL